MTDGDGEARFVVHRHRARRLHYDLRLEIDGALASWAVPKGPTLDPDVKRLAVRVEDHGMEHLDVEGAVGRGDTIIWDRGTWVLLGADDPVAAARAGELHAEMFGEKLRGRLVLVRRGRSAGVRGNEQWLLVHKHDEFAVPGWDPEEFPRSVRSGLTNDEVAALGDS